MQKTNHYSLWKGCLCIMASNNRINLTTLARCKLSKCCVFCIVNTIKNQLKFALIVEDYAENTILKKICFPHALLVLAMVIFNINGQAQPHRAAELLTTKR